MFMIWFQTIRRLAVSKLAFTLKAIVVEGYATRCIRLQNPDM